jgi:thiamine biosynthesis lipoprotein
MRRNSVVGAILLCILSASLAGCGTSPQAESYRSSQFLFDTEVYIEAYGSGAEAAGIKAMTAMAALDKALDIYDPESELARINSSAGITPQRVSADTFAVVQEAIEMAQLTGGYYNPAVGPLVELWRGAKEDEVLPEPNEIERLLPLTDSRAVELNSKNQTIFLSISGMSLDLGGIAKGYAVEQAVSILRQAGISSAMVVAGGNVYAIGKKPDGTFWRVGIRNPLEVKGVMGYIEIRDEGVDTAGDYERFYTVDGRKYGHILNPYTGYPPEDVTSCTVLADDPTLADALATAVVAMGLEQGMAFLEKTPGVEGMIIDAKGGRHFTQGFENRFVPYGD